jgi:hypothetical protein
MIHIDWSFSQSQYGRDVSEEALKSCFHFWKKEVGILAALFNLFVSWYLSQAVGGGGGTDLSVVPTKVIH